VVPPSDGASPIPTATQTKNTSVVGATATTPIPSPVIVPIKNTFDVTGEQTISGYVVKGIATPGSIWKISAFKGTELILSKEIKVDENGEWKSSLDELPNGEYEIYGSVLGASTSREESGPFKLSVQRENVKTQPIDSTKEVAPNSWKIVGMLSTLVLFSGLSIIFFKRLKDKSRKK
jgi:hypothetical protein